MCLWQVGIRGSVRACASSMGKVYSKQAFRRCSSSPQTIKSQICVYARSASSPCPKNSADSTCSRLDSVNSIGSHEHLCPGGPRVTLPFLQVCMHSSNGSLDSGWLQRQRLTRRVAAAGTTPKRKPEVHEDEHPARKSDVARRAAATDGIIVIARAILHSKKTERAFCVELPREPLRARTEDPWTICAHVRCGCGYART